MSHEVSLIFPHQLFEKSPILDTNRPVCLIEHPYFFTRFDFHIHKRILHRASMQAYADFLEKKKYKVVYRSYEQMSKTDIIAYLAKRDCNKIHLIDLVEHELVDEMRKSARLHGIELVWHETPMFLSDTDWLSEVLCDKEKWHHQTFYKKQRKRLGILMLKNGKPRGGKWSFDVENRKKLPRNHLLPVVIAPAENEYVAQARSSVICSFKKGYGNKDTFWYPTTHNEAHAWLDAFLDQRLVHFGDYEDAIVSDEVVLYHSVLSPLLNIGLLTPQQVIDSVLATMEKKRISLNNIEGFIRQIIGWREFVHGIYLCSGARQKRSNFWQHRRKIPQSFYEGTTGILPVDTIILSVLERSYAHHIERLMILGNFMLLCSFSPHEVYRWFSELFIDSYDWVMVPNVYGMSQYADGGSMVTKPYISSSNYVRKMSDVPKGPWEDVWDALFWTYIADHKDIFAESGRWAPMLAHLKKKTNTQMKQYEKTRATFLKNL